MRSVPVPLKTSDMLSRIMSSVERGSESGAPDRMSMLLMLEELRDAFRWIKGRKGSSPAASPSLCDWGETVSAASWEHRVCRSCATRATEGREAFPEMLNPNHVQLVALPGKDKSDPCIHVCHHFALEWLSDHVVRCKRRGGGGEEKESAKTGDRKTGLARFLDCVEESRRDYVAGIREWEEIMVCIRTEVPFVPRFGHDVWRLQAY